MTASSSACGPLTREGPSLAASKRRRTAHADEVRDGRATPGRSRSSSSFHQVGQSPLPQKIAGRRRSLAGRVLGRLKVNLAALEPWARRSAIEQMPTTMRLALLQFMLETRPQKAKKLVKATARPAKDTTKRAVFVATAAVAGQTPGLPKLCIKGIKGVRYVPTGLYQASIGYANLMIRSRTSRSLVHAQQLYAALRRFRALAKQEGACRGDVLLEEVLERAREQALAEVGISEEDLRPSFCVSISTGTWAGKVESPTTTSLRGALAWRRRLLDAKQA